MAAVEQLITENLDVWASAVKTRSSAGRGRNKKPDLYGVKKLRELILELAVRGKLVEQDPNEESASILLGRIAENKHLTPTFYRIYNTLYIESQFLIHWHALNNSSLLFRVNFMKQKGGFYSNHLFSN